MTEYEAVMAKVEDGDTAYRKACDALMVTVEQLEDAIDQYDGPKHSGINRTVRMLQRVRSAVESC